MRSLRVVLREEAIADLDELQRFIARSGAPRAAVRYIRRIHARCNKLGSAPFSGVPRDDLEPSLRTIGFERRALIAYRVLEDRVQITNVFYGGRDIELLYRDRREED